MFLVVKNVRNYYIVSIYFLKVSFVIVLQHKKKYKKTTCGGLLSTYSKTPRTWFLVRKGFCLTFDSFLSNGAHRVESDMDRLNMV